MKLQLELKQLNESIVGMLKVGNKYVAGTRRNILNSLAKSKQLRQARKLRQQIKRTKLYSKKEADDFLKLKPRLKQDFKKEFKDTMQLKNLKSIKNNPIKSSLAGVGLYYGGKHINDKIKDVLPKPENDITSKFNALKKKYKRK